jgi:SNF2 family DNA or RNA helicase
MKPLIPKYCVRVGDIWEVITPGNKEKSVIRNQDKIIARERLEKYNKDLTKWKRNGSKEGHEPQMPDASATSSWYNGRIAATLPLAIDAWTSEYGEQNMSQTDNSIIDKYIKDPLSKDFAAYLSTLGISAKILFVRKMCEKTQHEKRIDGFSRIKIIIMSRYPFIMAAVYNILARRFGSPSILRYAAGMSSNNKTQILNRWDNSDDQWILLAPVQSFTVGANLQRASRLIVMEPGAGWAESKQLIGRIDRQGQKEAEVRI